MLEKVVTTARVEVFENDLVCVHIKSSIIEDGVQISAALSQHLVAPGDDYSNEDPKVQAICAAVHTEEVVAAYKAMLEKA